MSNDSHVYVGGSRGTTGGLHLGHVYGCLSGLTLREEDQYYYVVSDCVPGCDDRSILRIALEVNAWSEGALVVRESQLRPHLRSLVENIEQATTFNRLRSTHPYRQAIQANDYDGSVSDFLFPIYQASYLLGLGATDAAYNDDNISVIHFSRRCRRKLLSFNLLSELHPEPRFVKKDPSRMVGVDGRKMSKKNGNVIPLQVSERRLTQLVLKGVGRAIGTGKPLAPSRLTEFEKACLQVANYNVESIAEIDNARERIDIIIDALSKRLEEFKLSYEKICDKYGVCSLDDYLNDSEAQAVRRIGRILTREGVTP